MKQLVCIVHYLIETLCSLKVQIINLRYKSFLDCTNSCFYVSAIQFVLSDEFSHLRPEQQRLALLHVSETALKHYWF